MDTLKNKRYTSYDYVSRYTDVAYYYDMLNDKDVYGIGTNLKTSSSWYGHQVKQTDTWDSLALTYYNNPTYWWIIANFNNVQDPFMKLSTKFSVVKIPSITNIEFGNERK